MAKEECTNMKVKCMNCGNMFETILEPEHLSKLKDIEFVCSNKCHKELK